MRFTQLIYICANNKTGDKNSREGLLKLLATSHSLHLSSIITTFQALPKPPSYTSNRNKQQSDNEADLILPLLFEAVMTVSIHDNNLPVKLRCPGIVLGTFLEF